MRPFTDPHGQQQPLRAVLDMFAELDKYVTSAGQRNTFDAITRVAVERVPGARAASITTLRHGKFSTVSATDDLARRGDALQYELGSGPCVDAILDRTLYRPEDLRHDDRWPEYGARANKELGWTSMLSYRLSTDLAGDDVIAGLNLYSERAHGFDAAAADVGLLLATHSALAIAADTQRDRADNLERALATSRDIGVAVGVLMTRHELTREQAFTLLRIASQNSNRKLRDLAADVLESGELPISEY
ncbi:MAG TPA: GAF and ANTAR domain-containing protein [Pseudonocardia sp.]|nr:GAF and ANTAR domain-containing protein [Pseudonocardia sp.]